MLRQSRRTFLIGSASLALTPPAFAASGAHDRLQDWIAAHAAAVRSIDFADDDFSDLELLAAAVASSRIVQLGEPSHGAGSSFAAKARIVRFLHQRMGFDVVAWESGLYDVSLTQAALRGEEDAVAAAQRGLFALWSSSSEVTPLFEYAKASQGSARPLDLAGFDLQATAKGTIERFAEDLTSFVASLRDRRLRMSLAKEAGRAVKSREAFYAQLRSQSADLKAMKKSLDGLQAAATALLGGIDSEKGVFVEAHGERTVSFMQRCIENMRVDGQNRYEARSGDTPEVERENRRDALNASNLRWLIEEKYRGRKIIVWAHNAHIMNAYYGSDWRSVYLDARPDAMKPTGVFLKEWYGDDVYTMTMTAYEGEDGWATAGTRTPVEAAAKDSLEERLHRLGQPYVFVDLRAAGGSPDHPMRKTLTTRFPKYVEIAMPDLRRASDGIFFIDRMAAATPVAG